MRTQYLIRYLRVFFEIHLPVTFHIGFHPHWVECQNKPFLSVEFTKLSKVDDNPQHLRTLAPKAIERLGHDTERLVQFCQFLREHWRHLRTTNVVESPFAAERLRTTAVPGLLPAVYADAQFVDGMQQTFVAQQEVAASFHLHPC